MIGIGISKPATIQVKSRGAPYFFNLIVFFNVMIGFLFVLFCSILFYFVLFCSVLFCSVRFSVSVSES